MIRPELKAELESIVLRLDESDVSELETKLILLTLLAALEARSEWLLGRHVEKFTRALVKALGKNMASRN